MSHVVIGAGFGDEGKGLMTDYLVRKHGYKTVARFNGGAQAGHTVQTATQRHVFSHVSSGTFAGADTWLDKHFVVNPAMLLKELKELEAKGLTPKVNIHHQAIVSTAFDVQLNQFAERLRAGARHGSCGLGINETITRSQAGFVVFANAFFKNIDYRENVLEKILDGWVEQRFAALANEICNGQATAEQLQLIREFKLLDLDTILKVEQNIIAELLDRGVDFEYEKVNLSEMMYEGAQGLMLDEVLGEFPHVTRSMTGLPYVVGAHYSTLTPVYVTRAYSTRHGAGKLQAEGQLQLARFEDKTNVPNEFQGTFRLAPLNIDDLKSFILADYNRAKSIALLKPIGWQIPATPVLAVTCLDQLGQDEVPYILDGRVRSTTATNLIKVIEGHVGFKVKYASYGPTAADVREL